MKAEKKEKKTNDEESTGPLCHRGVYTVITSPYQKSCGEPEEL